MFFVLKSLQFDDNVLISMKLFLDKFVAISVGEQAPVGQGLLRPRSVPPPTPLRLFTGCLTVFGRRGDGEGTEGVGRGCMVMVAGWRKNLQRN